MTMELEQLEKMTKAQMSQQRMPFLLAIKAGDTDTVKSLLKSIDPSEFLNYFTVQGSPLHFAVKIGDKEMVKLLLKHFDVNAKNHEYETPITVAVREGNEEMVKFLLEQGAKVFYQEFYRAAAGAGEGRPVNALLLACLQQDDKMVQLLLKSGAKLYGLQTGDENLNLAKSVRLFLKNNRFDMILKLLIGHAGYPGILSKIVREVLLYALENNDVELFGKMVNHPSRQFFNVHYYPLGFVRGKKAVLDLYCNCSSLPDMTKFKPFLDVLRLDATQKGSALHTFIHSGHMDALRFLLEEGADINSLEQNLSPLYLAVTESKKDIVEFLLDQGADINVGHGQGLNCYEPSNHYPRSEITRIFVKHVVELISEGEAVNEAHLTSINGVKELKDFKSQCEKEIEKLKENFIDSRISPLDLCKTTDLLQLTAYLMNRDIEDFLRLDNLELKFPIYAADVRKRLRKGFERKALLTRVSCFFQNLSTREEDQLPQLPANCVQTIFACLSNDDLVNLRNAYY